jgi:hypothetical protein
MTNNRELEDWSVRQEAGEFADESMRSVSSDCIGKANQS